MKHLVNPVVAALLSIVFMRAAKGEEPYTNLEIAAMAAVLQENGQATPKTNLIAECGQPILLVVSLKNTGTNSIVVDKNSFQMSNIRNGLLLKIARSGMTQEMPFLMSRSPAMTHPTVLAPNASIASTIVLTSYYPSFANPGRYEVEVSYDWKYDFYLAISNMAKVTCRPVRALAAPLSLTVISAQSFAAIEGRIPAIADEDLALHFINALANCAANGSHYISSARLAKWPPRLIKEFASRVRYAFPEMATTILEKSSEGASEHERSALEAALGVKGSR